jgi:hypothetical protein
VQKAAFAQHLQYFFFGMIFNVEMTNFAAPNQKRVFYQTNFPNLK